METGPIRFWGRFTRGYTALAVIVFNTLVIILLIEGAAALINTVRPPRSQLAETLEEYKQRMLRHSYYATQDWAAQYWDEHLQVVDHWVYQPYTVWRSLPFNGEQINVGEDALRVTPGSICGADTYRVYAFGGSTMWGFASPDWATIPAYLQARMEGRAACLVNQAELGFNSTQNLIRLIQLLERGDVPDMVIFYDGANDVYAAVEDAEAGSHYFIENIGPLVKGGLTEPEPTSSIVRDLLLRTQTARMLLGEPPLPQPDWALPPFDPALVEGIVTIYLENVHMAEALAQTYGFEFYAFIQPVLPVVDRPLNEEEQAIMWNTHESAAEMFQIVYPRWQAAAEEDERLVYLGNILDEQPYPIWVDFNHVTPWGNLTIAHEINNVIQPVIEAELNGGA